MSVKVTIKHAVNPGHLPGDYAVLYTNGGSGEIDYDRPASGPKPLFANGGGIFGFGLAPFGITPFALAWSSRCPGFGQVPFGYGPFGLGTVVIEAVYTARKCGTYKFCFRSFDSAGNRGDDEGQVLELDIHVRPDRPDSLKVTSYDPATDQLVFGL